MPESSPTPLREKGINGRFPLSLSLLLLALIGAGLLLAATRWGVGLSPDSAVYVAAARNYNQGLGLTVPFGSEINGPLAHHAPFYPLLLGLLARPGPDPLDGARWLQLLLFAANILLAGALLWLLHPGRPVWALAAAFFLLISPALFSLHSMAWTEALFLFLSFAGFACLALFLERGNWPLLLLTALCLGLALLTRYAGAALLATAVFALFLYPNRPWRARLIHTLLFGFLAGLPFLLWLLHSRGSGGTIRTLFFHPIGREQLQQGLNSVVGWFLIPDSLPTVVKLGLLAALLLPLGASLFLIYRQRGERPLSHPLLWLLLLFTLIYPAFLLFSISFFDANTPLDDRILSPLHVALLLLLIHAIATLWQTASRPRWQLAPLLALALLLAVGQIRQSAAWLRQGYQQGIGFNSLAWQQSPLIQAIAELDEATLLFANAPEPINIHTGRPVLRLPRKFESVTQQANSQYAAEMGDLRGWLTQEQGAVAYFTTLRIPTLPTADELISDLDLVVQAETADGRLYRPPQ